MTAMAPMRLALAALRFSSDPITAVLSSLLLAGPEDAFRPEDQDQDENGERDHVPELVGGGHVDAGEEQDRPDRLHHPEQQPADGRPGDAPDATEHRRGEGLDPGDEAHVV